MWAQTQNLASSPVPTGNLLTSCEFMELHWILEAPDGMIFWHTQACRFFLSLPNSTHPPFPSPQPFPFYYAGYLSPVSISKFPFLNASRASAEQGTYLWSIKKKDLKKEIKLLNVFPLDKSNAAYLQHQWSPLWKHFPLFCDSAKSSSLCQVGFRTHTVWNAFVACSASGLISKTEILHLTQYDVRSV